MFQHSEGQQQSAGSASGPAPSGGTGHWTGLGLHCQKSDQQVRLNLVGYLSKVTLGKVRLGLIWLVS